jgi:FKBP-type peptidyl-prolyl cis-trans isomerase FkpA
MFPMKSVMKGLLAALMLAGVLTSCLKSSSGNFNCSFNECGTVAPATEVDSVKRYLAQQGITALQHCSGLLYVVDSAGTGVEPTVCNNVAVTYQGRLTNGTVFETASTPVALSLNGVITGFQVGIPLIKSGGRIRLYIPPTLGYGNRTVGNIPPNSILIFDVRLWAVQ